MNQKLTLLTQLDQYCQEHGVLIGEYIAKPGSYCSIGFLLKETGMSDEEIYGIEPDRLISSVLHYGDIPEYVVKAGFSTLELQALQYANDNENLEVLGKFIEALQEGRDITSFDCYQMAKRVMSRYEPDYLKGEETK